MSSPTPSPSPHGLFGPAAAHIAASHVVTSFMGIVIAVALALAVFSAVRALFRRGAR